MSKINNEKTVIFDFDYVLFDPKKYLADVFDRLSKIHGDPSFQKTASALYLKAREGGYFSPDEYIKLISESTGGRLNSIKIEQIIYNQELITGAYYPKTLEVLDQLSKNCILVIFSTNNKDFFKLKAKKIIKYFKPENIIVEKEKRDFVYKLNEFTQNNKVYYVDDVIDYLKSVTSSYPDVISIWKKTVNYVQKKGDEGFVPNFIINDIIELPGIVLKK